MVRLRRLGKEGVKDKVRNMEEAGWKADVNHCGEMEFPAGLYGPPFLWSVASIHPLEMGSVKHAMRN